MSRKIRSYESDEVTVDFDAKRCIHAEECVHGLPEAFDASRRPWIDPTRASRDDLIRVIERCPTGALQYRRRDGAEGEPPPPTNTMSVDADGPLYLRGHLRLTLPQGETLEERRIALCRCGHSKDKPFCDNSHRDEGFSDTGEFSESRLAQSGEDQSETLDISLAPNGPILVRGPIHLRTNQGTTAEGTSGALCRCGLSAAKPFCDGSHKAAGFEAD